MQDAALFEVDFGHGLPALCLVQPDCPLMAFDLRSDSGAERCFFDLRYGERSIVHLTIVVFCHFRTLYALGCVRCELLLQLTVLIILVCARKSMRVRM